MWNSIKKAADLIAVIILSSALCVAGQTASMKLVGMGNGAMDGASVGPYVATINGVSTLVICDDYVDTSYIGQTWKATVSNPSDLSSAKWNATAGLAGYEEAAYLGTELMAAYQSGNVIAQGELSFAIWGLFDPAALTDLKNYNKTYWNAAQAYLNGAANHTYTNFSVYTPASGYLIHPQEFLVISKAVATPEPTSPALLGLDLCAALAVLVVARRYATR